MFVLGLHVLCGPEVSKMAGFAFDGEKEHTKKEDYSPFSFFSFTITNPAIRCLGAR